MYIPAGIASRIAAWRSEIPRVRAEDCPRCDSLSCAVAAGCLHRGTDEPPDLVCRWLAEIAAADREQELTELRRQRLVSAGCGHPRALAEVPAGRRLWPPPREWVADRDAGHVRRALDAARAWLADPALLVLSLSGGCGSGKSYLAAQLVADGRGPALWVQATAVGRFGEWFDREGAPGLGTRALRAPLLVLDDLGTEAPNASSHVVALLEERINLGRRTVVTHNLTGRALEQRLGARIASRFAESGVCADMGASDLRVAARVAADRAAGRSP